MDVVISSIMFFDSEQDEAIDEIMRSNSIKQILRNLIKLGEDIENYEACEYYHQLLENIK